jgi:hypothetical protein
LPPAPEAVEAFVKTGDYEALVDRLLASPAYGERWGRHWLDVARYGESNGYEQNHLRPNAWPYRDYVIRAFNADTPFRDMILQQIAGDVVAPGDPAIEVATAFLVAGPHDTVGNQAEAFKRQQRADDYDDMVNATASAFLGLTVNCARCHDHKFDPILQSDYYRLASVFAGVFHGEREIATAAQREAYRAAAAPVEARIAAARKRLEALRAEAAPRLAEAEARVRGRMRPPVSAAGTEESFSARASRFVRLEFPQGAGSGLDEIEVFSGGVNVARGARVKASSTRVADGNPDAYHPRALNDGAYDKRWFPAAGAVSITLELAEAARVDRVLWSVDRQQAFQGRFAPQPPGRYVLSLSADGESFEKIATGDDRLPARAEAAERLFLIEALGPGLWEPAEAELAAAEEALRKIEKLPRVYAGILRKPEEPVYLLRGGNVMQRGAAMAPGSLSALAGFELSVDAPESERRLVLAKWIASDANPLTPRVIVNRLWHYHFGRGIAGTPSDFGFNGERPTHPELLDYLAGRLLEYGWRLKPLHREIVLSRTYRQSSAYLAEAAKADADARLLWRFPPRRLEAEAIRDAMLSVAGVLQSTSGGPGFQLYKYTVDNVATYFPLDRFGPETYRRAVYAQPARSISTEPLTILDCPDSSLPEPRRVVTTSPLQALTLLNNSFTLDMAKAFAARVQAEADAVGRAFQLAFSRAPAREERAAAEALMRQHGLEALARALFNTNEFVYVH